MTTKRAIYSFRHGDEMGNTLIYDPDFSKGETVEIKNLLSQDEIEIEWDLKVWQDSGDGYRMHELSREGRMTVPLR